MSITKRVIPSLSFAGLALSGCGSSSASPPSFQQAINNLCAKSEECGHGTANDCLAAFNVDTFEQAILTGGGQDCVNAYAAYFACESELNCDDYNAAYNGDLIPCPAEADVLDNTNVCDGYHD